MNLKLLRTARKNRNLSQAEMARKLGYKNRSSYCLIESGYNQLPISKIKTVSDILQLNDEEFKNIFWA